MSTSAGSSATPPGSHPLDRHRGKVGKMPDADVAAVAGVSVDEVKLYRREHNIAAFLRPPPGARDIGSGQSVRLVRPDPPAPAAPSLFPAVGAAGTGPATLEAHRDRLGSVADQVIADELGLSRRVVGDYRRKLGIKAYEGYLFTPGPRTAARPERSKAEPSVASSPAAAAPSETGRSTIDAYRDMLGTVPDSEVAALAGVSRAAVTKYRTRRGIRSVEPAPLHLTNGLPGAASAPSSVPMGPPSVHEAPAAGSAPRPSLIDPHRAHVGVLADRAVAELAGVTPEAVRMYRKRHGIPAAERPAPAEMTHPPVVPTEPVVAVPEPEFEAASPAVPASTEAGPPAPAAPSEPSAREDAATVLAPEADDGAGPPEPEPTVTGTSAVAGHQEIHAFQVTAARGDERHRFVCIGADITQGLALAVRALASRTDGPWRVLAIRQGMVALVEPAPAPKPAAPRPVAPRVAASPVVPTSSSPAPVAVPSARTEAPTATGDDLRRFRQTHELSQRELGLRLGTGQGTVSKLESCGPKTLPAPLAKRFAELLRAGG